MQKRNLEGEVLEFFLAEANEVKKRTFTKQGANNRVLLSDNSWFQFGDLRVDTSSSHIIVEVESSGGVTNLVKYWLLLDQKLITKQLTLIHLFQKKSRRDYLSHLNLWNFLSQHMEKKLTGRFDSRLFTFDSGSLKSSLQPAILYFRECLRDNSAAA